jgi:hypothetical protein
MNNLSKQYAGEIKIVIILPTRGAEANRFRVQAQSPWLKRLMKLLRNVAFLDVLYFDWFSQDSVPNINILSTE